MAEQDAQLRPQMCRPLTGCSSEDTYRCAAKKHNVRERPTRRAALRRSSCPQAESVSGLTSRRAAVRREARVVGSMTRNQVRETNTLELFQW